MKTKTLIIFALAASSILDLKAADPIIKHNLSNSINYIEIESHTKSEIISAFRYYLYLSGELDRINKMEESNSPKGQLIINMMSAYSSDDGNSVLEKNIQLFELLVNNNIDKDFIYEFLQMGAVYYKRSADESVSIITVKLYSKNCNVFNEAIKMLTTEKQEIVIKMIDQRIDSLDLSFEDKKIVRAKLESIANLSGVSPK